MQQNTPASKGPVSSTPELGAAAQEEWNGHVDAVLRGVSHALNNRAAALSALVQLADDAEPPDMLRGILATELERMTELAAAIRSIGTPRAGEEAFTPGDAATEAQAVLGLHAEQREASTQISALGSRPVRTRRPLFVRALIALGANAGRVNPRAVVEITSSEHEVTVRSDDAPASAYVAEVARAMGGEAIDEGRGFRLPTLAAVRQREGS